VKAKVRAHAAAVFIQLSKIQVRRFAAAVARARVLEQRLQQRRHVEQLGDALPALDLAQQHPSAAGGQGAREAGRDRGFACATLPTDDVQGVPRSHDTPVIVSPAWVW
jgi:hypothetical protein